jgi:hypothetical protein
VIQLFLGLTVLNLLCLSITAALGYAVMQRGADWGSYHQLAGVLATLVCCAVHCIVFTYFIATAKWLLHAIEVKQLDPAIALPTRSFKAQAFPAAVIAMLFTFAAAVLGAATLSYEIPPLWHHAMALLSISVNVAVAVVEYRSITRNGQIIDHVLERINGEKATAAG